MRFIFVFLVVALSGCGVSNSDFRVKKWITTTNEYNRVFLELVSRTDELPKGALVDARFQDKYTAYFKNRLKVHEFKSYYISDSVRYFELYRKAPSLFDEKIIIGGKYKTDNQNEIKNFEIVYMSVKQKPEIIDLRANELFTEMINTGSVKSLLNKPGYVDFPNENYRFDTKFGDWVYLKK